MKSKQQVLFLLTLMFSLQVRAVQVAFFVDDQDGSPKLEGEFTHVAISYKGKWLHSHPSRVNGRLSAFPGVHLSQNLSEIGLNFIVFENVDIPEPDEVFYKKFKDRAFNILAEWNSTTDTHCSILVGKFLVGKVLGLKPSRMKFKSKLWRLHPEAKKMRGKLGMSPKEIFEKIVEDPSFRLFYQSPFSTYKLKARKLKCSSFL